MDVNYFIAGQQSFIPSNLIIDSPSPFNGIDGGPSSFGSACVEQSSIYSCNSNAENPLFDCSKNNNSYYGWETQNPSFSMSVNFINHFQSINVLVIFLISNSNNVSVPASLQYTLLNQNGLILQSGQDYLSTNLPEGPYQHNFTLSSDVMFNGVLISIFPNTSFQWVAIGRIIFCAAVIQGMSSSPLLTYIHNHVICFKY